MAIEIVQVERVEGYGLIVYYSDGTNGRYTVDELLELRPYRDSSCWLATVKTAFAADEN